MVMPKLIAASALPDLLSEGANVFIQGGSGEPTALLTALRERGGPSNVSYVAVFPPGINRWDPAAFAPQSTMTAFFATPELAETVARGATRLLSLPYGEIYRHLYGQAPIDVALIQVAPTSSRHEYSLGLSVDFVPAALNRARIVVAEINRAMPAAPGSPTIPASRIDFAVEVDHPLPEAPDDEPDTVSLRLARQVATLVRDGDTIQTGMGRIPSAVLAALGEKNDLGFHSGLLTEPVLRLMEAGVITGARKPIDRGAAVTGIAFGSQGFYQAIGGRYDVLFRPVAYTHAPGVLRELNRFVAINSAIEVDLLGQINSEAIGSRQISGVGGLKDFTRGARLANGGRSIIALTSRAGLHGASRIVRRVSKVTCPASDVAFVVTEHGVADLREPCAEARAAAIIAIAAPEFRDDLAESLRNAPP